MMEGEDEVGTELCTYCDQPAAVRCRWERNEFDQEWREAWLCAIDARILASLGSVTTFEITERIS